MQQNGEILDFKRHYREFTSSYGMGTKFIRNTGLYKLVGKTWSKHFQNAANGEILDFKRHYREFTSSYGVGTKFIRNIMAYLTSS